MYVCAAGLPHSYMATAALGQSLMLDFKCVINPYTAYISAIGKALRAKSGRVDHLAKTMTVRAEISKLLADRTCSSDWEI